MTGTFLFREQICECPGESLFQVILPPAACAPGKARQTNEVIRVHSVQISRYHAGRQIHMDQQPAGSHEVRLQSLLRILYNFFTAVAFDRPSMASSFSPTDNAMAGYSLKSASSFSRWSG